MKFRTDKRTIRFAAANLDPKADGEAFPKVIEALARDDQLRTDFLKACLSKIGLHINQEQNTIPSLSRLHLTSMRPSDISGLISSWQDLISNVDGEEYIKDDNDTFHIEKPSIWSLGALTEALPEKLEEIPNNVNAEDRFPDLNKIVKHMRIYEEAYPTNKETPYFNHHAFNSSLLHYMSIAKGTSQDFGKYLLYGEVVTSTNTMLEK